ncbi:MAG: hypothetical protein DBY27_01875 [Clostridiaceae bacterium]|nr:MAG: hypothetical protein DBY27_01875 [Clostridiaceae bacterium]
MAPTVAPTTAPDAGTLQGDIKVTGDWGTGGLATITIKNTTGKTFSDGWTVSFDCDRSIKNCWSGTLTNVGTNSYTISNPGWDSYLASGATITLNVELGSGTATPTVSNISLK